jgi:hypothetical protein
MHHQNNYDTNIIFNMMMASAITTFIASLTKFLPRLINNFNLYMADFYECFLEKKKGRVIISSTTIQSNGSIRPVFPIEYRAVIAKLKKEKINLKYIAYVDKNDDAKPWFWREKEQQLENGIKDNKFYVNSKDIFHLDNKIKISFNTHETLIGGDQNPQRISYNDICVFSKYYGVDELQNIIIDWTKEYIENIKCGDNDEKQYYFGLEYSNVIENTKKNDLDISLSQVTYNLKWNKYELKSFKMFNNIYFTNKHILMKKLNYFLNNEVDYKKKGIPYNLGFLFYGEPGCGKTSCIKAIANHTNRHVVEINLKNIKSCKDFINTFNAEYINDQYIPHKKKIIVLEDIDCMIDIVKSRKESDTVELSNMDNVKDDMIKLMMIKEKNEFEGKKNLEQKLEDKLTLSCILNTIDGILESYGRILIITTNFVDRLDEALIRPGRIDMKVDFTKCTEEMYRDIIETFFEIKLDCNIKFENYKHTPAEVIDICCLYNDDLKKVLHLLCVD